MFLTLRDDILLLCGILEIVGVYFSFGTLLRMDIDIGFVSELL